ncbi:MAG: adenylate/guanylate cyclase domain-containing protein [Anaerolineae bacterium]
MITCPKCQHANADNLKFCENCGNKLTSACPNCGQAISPNAKFCGNCGAVLKATEDPQLERLKRLVPKEFAERLLKAQGGRVERERRVVTILFSDVKGSTAMGEERDPEEVMEVMNGAFDALIEPIYRYEGTLARLMGDAILAFFGAPVAHEDDPVRAVLAALAIQDKMKGYAAQLGRTHRIHDFGVRVGINTGLVVVGEVGSDLRVEYTAMGDAINVASRLENAAAPGSIVISGTTARLARHALELESLGGLALKGKSEPVLAFRVVGRKATMESARGIEGLRSPLVGRQKELAQLIDAVEKLGQGHGQIVSVMGEAGLGKSRLTAELRKHYASSPIGEGDGAGVAGTGVRWFEGRSFSFETATPFAPFIDLLNGVFGLAPEEKDLDKYDQVRARLGEWIPGRGEQLAPFIAALMGIELADEDVDHVRYLLPPDLRERMFRAVVDLVQALASKQPLVLVLEDLHWADPSSLDLALRLFDLTDHTMLMVLALFRPQRQEPSWRFHETAARDYAHRYSAIMIEPLDEGQSRELVANLLEIEDLPESVRTLILKKAEGNPFFVEEVIRSLLDARLVVREDGHWRATREIQNIAVPDTLAGVITARLDRLDEEAKRVTQTAAVIGREFQLDVLQEVYEARSGLDDSLRNLQRRELIREKSRMPLVLYLFKHALTQETAYASVLMSKRRELHRRVAECLERVDQEQVNDIARHFLEAKEEQRALPYLLAAGERAARSYSMPEAIGYYRRAVEIAVTGNNLGLTRRAYEGLGNALGFVFDIPGTIKIYEEMLDLGIKQKDIPMQVSARNKLGMTLSMRMGQFPEAEKHLLEAEQLAREHGDKVGLAELYFIRCGMCTAAGDFDNVINYMDQAAQFGRELGIKDQIAAAQDHVARSHIWMTRFKEGWKVAQDALALARAISNREVEASLLSTTFPLYHLRNGDFDAGIQSAEKGVEIATRIGSLNWIIYGNWASGEAMRLRGEYEKAIDHFQMATDAAAPLAGTLTFGLVQPQASLGLAYIEMSDVYAVQANELHMQSLKLMESPMGAAAGGTAWIDIGFCAMLQGNFEIAGGLFQKGLAYPTMFGYYNKPQFLIGSALVSLAGGRLDEAEHLVEEARSFVEEREMRNLYPSVALTHGQVLAAQHKDEQALELFARAVELGDKMKMRPVVWQAHAHAARVLTALGRASQAAVEEQAARSMIEEMAGLFNDPEMRQAFVASASRRLASALQG